MTMKHYAKHFLPNQAAEVLVNDTGTVVQRWLSNTRGNDDFSSALAGSAGPGEAFFGSGWTQLPDMDIVVDDDDDRQWIKDGLAAALEFQESANANA